jgi:acyl-CoA thioesterase
VISCASDVINRGKTVVHVESHIFVGDALVGTANGNFAIFKPR